MDGKVHDWQKGQPYQGSVLPKTKNRFKICTNPIQGGGKLLPVSVIPQQGDFVKTSNFGQLQLEKKIGEGGEGKIFTTPRGSICKVYLKSKLTEHRVNKLQLMLSKPVDIPGICWPLDIIHNQNDEPVGYMMPKAEGLPIQQAVFIRAIFEKSFPNWNRRHLVAFTRTFLERIKTLQDRNVLIGDLNPMNILIKSESEVYFVDTDSYQLEMFPCPVGMAHFTAPEIQGKNYSTFLRTPEHEHFALATMLFMILLPGKPPYSHQGGGNPAGNIKKGLFPYPFEENSKRKAPIGSWRYIWSNLPYKTKEAFYNCFTSGKRPTTDEWLHLIRHYQTTLLHGHLTNEIFPSSLKPVSNHAQQTFGVSATKYIKFACEACGQDFTMLEEKAQKIQKVKKKLCRKCFEKKKREAEQRRIDQETGDMIVCNRCFDSFLFSLGEKKFYSKNGYVPPKYCKKCREKRKFDPARPQLFKPKTFRLQPLLHNFYQRSKRKISYPNSLILPYRSRKPRIL